jgi:prepilin-type N-terminal cleavage/methylation domain-containing protein
MKRRAGFTLIEIMAVMILMAFIFGVTFSSFKPRSARLKQAAYQMSQVIQTTYLHAVKSGSIHQIKFKDDNKTISVERYYPPLKKPQIPDAGETEEYRKKLEQWEDAQDALQQLSPTERSRLTRYQRGSFREVVKKEIDGPISIKNIFSTREWGEEEAPKLVFYPSGEVDQAVIVLDDGAEKFFSLEINPLSGKVTTKKGETTEEEWKKQIGSE